MGVAGKYGRSGEAIVGVKGGAAGVEEGTVETGVGLIVGGSIDVGVAVTVRTPPTGTAVTLPRGTSSNGESPPRIFARAVAMDWTAVSGVREIVGTTVERGTTVDVGVLVIVPVGVIVMEGDGVELVGGLPVTVGVRSMSDRAATSVTAIRVVSTEAALASD